MLLHVLSDLHLEYCDYQPPAATMEADVIVLAGDIEKADHGIAWARGTWPNKEIVYVAGNHEFYGRSRENVLSQCHITAKDTGVHFLDNAEVMIDSVRFLGCTLWTDFTLYGEDLKLDCMAIAQRGLNDFRVIHEGAAHFSPNDALRLHEESVRWLEHKLQREPSEGPTVVVTHHAPSFTSVVPRYRKDLLTACFASQLDHLLGFSELWLHGHMHDSLDYTVANTRVLCNPRGYSRFERACENPLFAPGLLVEVKSRQVAVTGTETMEGANREAAKALLGLARQSCKDYGMHY